MLMLPPDQYRRVEMWSGVPSTKTTTSNLFSTLINKWPGRARKREKLEELKTEARIKQLRETPWLVL